MLQVRENKISLRKWSSGDTAQLLTLEGRLVGNIELHHFGRDVLDILSV